MGQKFENPLAAAAEEEAEEEQGTAEEGAEPPRRRLQRSRTTYRLGAQLNVDEVVVETSPATLADYPLLEKPLEEPKPVRVTHLPFDVDSSALTVSSLIEAVERIWLANLQRVFVSVFKDEWDQKHGTGAWDEKLRAAWDAVFDDSVANSPFKVANVSFKGNRMEDDDMASLDDIEMVELQLIPSVVDSDGEVCGTVRQDVSLQLADDDKTYSVTAEVERKRIFCYLVPFKFRVPTASRKQNAGVSCLKICNWDVALMWPKLETSAERKGLLGALTDVAAKTTGALAKGVHRHGSHDHGLQKHATEVDFVDENEYDDDVTDQEETKSRLLHALLKADLVQIDADDTLDFITNARINKMREVCIGWQSRPEKKAKSARLLPMLQEFERGIAEIDRLDDFLSAESNSIRQRVAELKDRVAVLMEKFIRDRIIQLSSDDMSEFIGEQRMKDTIRKAEGMPAGGERDRLVAAARELGDLLTTYHRNKMLLRMKQAGLIVTTRACVERKSRKGYPMLMTMITAPKDRFEYEAEAIGMIKRVCSLNPTVRGPRIPFFQETEEDFYPYRPYFEAPSIPTGTRDCVFTHSEREDLLWSIIRRDHEKPPTATEGVEMATTQLGAEIDVDDVVLSGVCEGYFSLHHTRALEVLRRDWVHPMQPPKTEVVDGEVKVSRPLPRWGDWLLARQPYDEIRDYLGTHLTWYFAWQSYYCRALIIPSVFGLITVTVNLIWPEAPTLPLYSLFISLWATMFLKTWAREQHRIAFRWNVQEGGNEEGLRRQFVKSMRALYNDVDSKHGVASLARVLPGVPEPTIGRDIEEFDLWFFPNASRKYAVLFSAFATLLCMIIVGCLTLFTFEVKRWLDDSGAGARPSMIIKGVLSGLLIPGLNYAYARLAKTLTEREHHALEYEHEQSLVMKKFAFRFVNAYNGLFYIAFLRSEAFFCTGARQFVVANGTATADQCGIDDESPYCTSFVDPGSSCSVAGAEEAFSNMGAPPELPTGNEWGYAATYNEDLRMRQLATELTSLMVTGQVIGLIIEVVLPAVKSRAALTSNIVGKHKGTDTKRLFLEAEQQSLAQAWQGNIDEYLKMVIQFGYVAFFCCSFPLVPFVAYINNCMECRIDAGKLCYVQQKPDGRNAPDIGIWLHIMQLMTIIAVVVNSALLESLQGGIMAIFPESILESDFWPSLQDSEWKLAYQALFIGVVLEHLILATKSSISIAVPDAPGEIEDQAFREDYFATKQKAEYMERRQRALGGRRDELDESLLDRQEEEQQPYDRDGDDDSDESEVEDEDDIDGDEVARAESRLDAKTTAKQLQKLEAERKAKAAAYTNPRRALNRTAALK